MKHKVAELEGALLDAAVAKAEGWKPKAGSAKLVERHEKGLGGEPIDTSYWEPPRAPGYSTEWKLGGPIIERERISMQFGMMESPGQWAAWHPAQLLGAFGTTALIAAMRAYVASRFGDEVELPDGAAIRAEV